MVSESILTPPSAVVKYIGNINELKLHWDQKILLPSEIDLFSKYKKIHQKWKDSDKTVGEIKSMKHRAELFKNLYYKNPSFYFGLSTAHLTLGIDRFASLGKNLRTGFQH